MTNKRSTRDEPNMAVHSDTSTIDTQASQDTQRNTPPSLAKQPASDAIWDLPLKDFLERAIDRAKGEVGEMENWQIFFHFVRLVKGFYKEGVSSDEAFDTIAPYIMKMGDWTELFDDVIGVSDYETAYAMFVSLWAKIRYRPDESPLDNALQKAEVYPLATTRGQKRPMPQYDRFISLAGWLQVSMGDRSILLPCREVAETLKTTRNMVSIWRNWAIEDGYLKIERHHRFGAGGQGEATSFRFDTRRWKILSRTAERGSGVSFDLADAAPELPTQV